MKKLNCRHKKTLAACCNNPADYHGFTRYDFKVEGCDVIVVVPKKAARGNPWIWRAEYFDHRPETDLALLARGFYLVYMNIGFTVGSPKGMALWNGLYQELTTQYGFAKKPALEGLSIGGLYAYNWATTNPDKVACIYADNPVCDFRICPGGKGKSPQIPDLWQKLCKAYLFASEAEALAYPKNPVDNLASLAKAGIPLLHVCGDADEVVPFEENTLVLKDRYEQLGGKIELIIKKGFKHHPHGLDDPLPIVNFIIKHCH